MHAPQLNYSKPVVADTNLVLVLLNKVGNPLYLITFSSSVCMCIHNVCL